METQAQNGTDTQTSQQITVPPVPPPEDLQLLKQQQEEWITFTAIGGLVTEADGLLKPMTIVDFSNQLGVPRRTLYNWRKSIPKFWERVDVRRREMFGKDRIAKVWNGVYLRAAKGDAPQAQMILSHFSDYRPPAQSHEIEVKGWGDAIVNARKKMLATQHIIEAEVVNGSSPTSPE